MIFSLPPHLGWYPIVKPAVPSVDQFDSAVLPFREDFFNPLFLIDKPVRVWKLLHS